MPYIPKEDRTIFDPHVDALVEELDALPEDKLAGCLNYCVSRLNRRQIAPYEDGKIESAGDVGKPGVP